MKSDFEAHHTELCFMNSLHQELRQNHEHHFIKIHEVRALKMIDRFRHIRSHSTPLIHHQLLILS